jgi:hypothetical protein
LVFQHLNGICNTNKIIYIENSKNPFIPKTPSERFKFVHVMACKLMLYMVPGCENEIKLKLVKAPCVGDSAHPLLVVCGNQHFVAPGVSICSFYRIPW